MTGTTPAAATGVSTDGRSFVFTVTVAAPFAPGEFVTFAIGERGTVLGHVESHSTDIHGDVYGFGRVLGAISPDGMFDSRHVFAFRDASIAAAGPEAIEQLHRASRATLAIGAFASNPEVHARLLPHRFNRHTFWCGQSGSGKTYALGVLVEQLLQHTELPIVIFDPNADFVRLRDVREDAPGEEAESMRSRDIRILRPGGDGLHLRARFTTLPLRVKAALLRLDPLRDRDEYNTLVHLDESLRAEDTDGLMRSLRQSENAGDRALALRIDNLGVLSWSVWARDEAAATEIIVDRPDATVLDLGGFAYTEEPLIAALSVLDDLWQRREERRPILIVIDEAHNLCSPDLTSPLQVAIREQIMQIAAEGRKFGLWLLLSTQRPSKIHSSIISQCDNVALMKMSSPLDLKELAAVFGFAPEALIAQSPHFRQGEVLFAGGFVPAPSVVQVRGRVTHEGGVDVSVPLRA
jgi:uncharacterized protein